MKQRTTPIGQHIQSAKAAIEQAKADRVKKTALQEAFSLVQELHPSLFDVHTETGRTFVNTFHKFLDIEKQQIVDAFNEGALDGLQLGEQYFNFVYKP